MSETPAEQRVSGLSVGPKAATLLDIRAITQRYELSGAAVARITGVVPRTVRKWLAPPEADNHAPMPYAAWRLLLIETGVVSPRGIPDK
jgi:DNA-binding transcriptional regulator YiaG